MGEGCSVKRWQDGAIEHGRRRRGPVRRKEYGEESDREGGRRDLFCDQAQKDRARGATQRIRAIKSCFMPPQCSPVENEVAFRQA